MNGKMDADCAVAPELLVKRWQESRLFFPRDERTRCAWLRAAWLPSSDHRSLEMHWARSAPANR